MNYFKITKFDTANGPGIRVVLWVSGCSHYCKNCQNQETWDPSAGNEFTEDSFKEVIKSIDKSFINGITFSGGDPLYPKNKDTITRIAKYIKENYPNKTIWCYTGYLYEQIKHLDIIQYLDVLVDGEYHDWERNITLPYCGSENQRVIDVKKTIQNDKVILYSN